MELTQKVVLVIPLNELWTDESYLSIHRGKHLNSKDISDLLLQQKIQFVIADVGHKLQWQPLDNCYELYKAIKSQIIDDFARIDLSHFKNDSGFSATLWDGEKHPIVLLEKYH